MKIGRVTISDRTAAGIYADRSGPEIERVLRDALGQHAVFVSAVVPDEIEDIATAIREAMQRRTQFIITTGGLGPTFDDKTLQGLSKALNRRLEVNKEALKMVREKYEAYLHNGKAENGDLTPPRVKMATIPEGTKPVPNPIGTAPAVLAETDAAVIVSLPGVPREMEAIFDETVAPMLKKASRDVYFYEKRIYANKIMESNIAPIIAGQRRL